MTRDDTRMPPSSQTHRPSLNAGRASCLKGGELLVVQAWSPAQAALR